MSLIKLALESFALPIFGPEVLPDQQPDNYPDQNRVKSGKGGLLIDKFMSGTLNERN